MAVLQNSVCPHCGAVLNFTTSTKVVHCDFCDSDIILEQTQSPQIPEQNVPFRQGQNFPPAMPFDEPAFLKWKKKFRICHIILAVMTVIFVLLVEVDSSSDAAIPPFLGGLLVFAVSPVILGITKPDEPDASRNRKGWNVFKYYLLSAVNIVVSFIAGALIAGILGLV